MIRRSTLVSTLFLLVSVSAISLAADHKRILTVDVALAKIAGGALTASSTTSLPVLYFDTAQVAAAFDRGAVVLGEEPGRNYQVHASRREKAGEVEVHLLDTDIFYVLRGTATFVTGGTVVGGKTTAPNEILGASIRDGKTHQLVKGDVIIVPQSTPHWFKQVKAPFLYFVVKVR